MITRSLLATAVGISLPSASADDFTFETDGDWYTAGDVNWSPDPNGASDITAAFFNIAGNNAVVNAAANYNAGGDFLLGAGNSMIVDGAGASWTQAVGVGNWVKVGASAGHSTVVLRNGGTLNVLDPTQFRVGQDGGTAAVTVEGTAGGLNLAGTTGVGSGSALNIQGGTNSLAAIENSGAVHFSGGTTTTGQFNGAGAYTVSGATTSVIATNYSVGAEALSVSAGSISFNNLTNVKAAVTGGSVTVGNTFSTNASTSLQISGGSVTMNGGGNVNLNPAATFVLSGDGEFIMAGGGEFQPGSASGAHGIFDSATLNIAGIAAFQSALEPNRFEIAGGSITIGGTSNRGIFSNGSVGYFDFTLDSTGSILFTNVADAEVNIFESQIRYQGTTYANLLLAQEVFDISHPTESSTLIRLIPEPTSAILAGLGALGLLGIRRRSN